MSGLHNWVPSLISKHHHKLIYNVIEVEIITGLPHRYWQNSLIKERLQKKKDNKVIIHGPK